MGISPPAQRGLLTGEAMLSTVLFTVSAVVALVAAVAALRIAILAYRIADDAKARAEKRDAETPDQARLLQLAGEVTNIQDAFDSLHSQLRKLRSRVTMRERRENANGADPSGTPDQVKAALRRKWLDK